MLEILGLGLGIYWLGLGLFEGKLIGIFCSLGMRQYRLILKGSGYASSGVVALYSSTLDESAAWIVLIIAAVIFAGTWYFLRHIT